MNKVYHNIIWFTIIINNIIKYIFNIIIILMDINPNVRNFYFLNQIFILNTDLPTINEALLFKFNHILSVQNNLNAIEITQRDIIAFFIYFKNEYLLFDISRCVTQSFLSNNISKYNTNIVNDTFLRKTIQCLFISYNYN